jgi:hypothetical protein
MRCIHHPCARRGWARGWPPQGSPAKLPNENKTAGGPGGRPSLFVSGIVNGQG